VTYCVTVTELLIDPDNLIRADGIVLGRLVTEADVTYIEVKDRDHLRSQQRGTEWIRVPVVVLGQLREGTR